MAVGGIPIQYNQLSESELDELANFKPTLTYGQAKQAPPEDFVPGHVAWDKKVRISLSHTVDRERERDRERGRERESIAIVENNSTLQVNLSW